MNTVLAVAGNSKDSSLPLDGAVSFSTSNPRKHILQLAAIMICVALAVALTSIWLLYRAAFDEQRDNPAELGCVDVEILQRRRGRPVARQCVAAQKVFDPVDAHQDCVS